MDDNIQKAIETQKSIYEALNRSLISSESAGLVFIPVDWMEDIKAAISAMQELQQYRQIGTPVECQKAIEKQIPTKPISKQQGLCRDT